MTPQSPEKNGSECLVGLRILTTLPLFRMPASFASCADPLCSIWSQCSWKCMWVTYVARHGKVPSCCELGERSICLVKRRTSSRWEHVSSNQKHKPKPPLILNRKRKSILEKDLLLYLYCPVGWLGSMCKWYCLSEGPSTNLQCLHCSARYCGACLHGDGGKMKSLVKCSACGKKPRTQSKEKRGTWRSSKPTSFSNEACIVDEVDQITLRAQGPITGIAPAAVPRKPVIKVGSVCSLCFSSLANILVFLHLSIFHFCVLSAGHYHHLILCDMLLLCFFFPRPWRLDEASRLLRPIKSRRHSSTSTRTTANILPLPHRWIMSSGSSVFVTSTSSTLSSTERRWIWSLPRYVFVYIYI